MYLITFCMNVSHGTANQRMLLTPLLQKHCTIPLGTTLWYKNRTYAGPRFHGESSCFLDKAWSMDFQKGGVFERQPPWISKKGVLQFLFSRKGSWIQEKVHRKGGWTQIQQTSICSIFIPECHARDNSMCSQEHIIRMWNLYDYPVYTTSISLFHDHSIDHRCILHGQQVCVSCRLRSHCLHRQNGEDEGGWIYEFEH